MRYLLKAGLPSSARKLTRHVLSDRKQTAQNNLAGRLPTAPNRSAARLSSCTCSIWQVSEVSQALSMHCLPVLIENACNCSSVTCSEVYRSRFPPVSYMLPQQTFAEVTEHTQVKSDARVAVSRGIAHLRVVAELVLYSSSVLYTHGFEKLQRYRHIHR
jgi:hypothetical protein